MAFMTEGASPNAPTSDSEPIRGRQRVMDPNETRSDGAAMTNKLPVDPGTETGAALLRIYTECLKIEWNGADAVDIIAETLTELGFNVDGWDDDQLDAMRQHYIKTALWSSSDLDDDDRSLQVRGFTMADFGPSSRDRMLADVWSFYLANIADLVLVSSPEQAGHDFWLTRNGHGAGFRDRRYAALSEVDLTPEQRVINAAFDRLAADAKDYGESILWVGGDDRIHEMQGGSQRVQK